MKILSPDTPISSEPRIPAGIVLKPFRIEDIAPFVDHDPAEAEALVAVVRELRREGREPSAE